MFWYRGEFGTVVYYTLVPYHIKVYAKKEKFWFYLARMLFQSYANKISEFKKCRMNIGFLYAFINLVFILLKKQFSFDDIIFFFDMRKTLEKENMVKISFESDSSKLCWQIDCSVFDARTRSTKLRKIKHLASRCRFSQRNIQKREPVFCSLLCSVLMVRNVGKFGAHVDKCRPGASYISPHQ